MEQTGMNTTFDETPESDTKTYVVSDKGDRLKFPSTIPKTRTNCINYSIAVIMILCLLESWYLNDFNKMITLEGICYGILIHWIGELLYRVMLSIEEILHHFKQRYGSSIKNLWSYFATYKSFCVPTVSGLFVYYCYMDHGLIDFKKLDTLSILSIEIFVYLLGKITNAEVAHIYNSLRFEEKDGLNYSSAMAHSFYHGYLRLILPKTGGEDKNLTEIIEVYSARHRVCVFPKLFILVPKSGVCPVSLEGKNIEESSSLDEKQLTIAGVQKRSYKNSVYKIREPNKKFEKPQYVCVEYATPLRTFTKALEASGKYNEYFRKHKDDIILHFYLITRDLIRNDPEICDLCELIFYDDRGEKKRTIDVSNMLRQKIKKKKHVQPKKTN